jgi:hypothetical protein
VEPGDSPVGVDGDDEWDDRVGERRLDDGVGVGRRVSRLDIAERPERTELPLELRP